MSGIPAQAQGNGAGTVNTKEKIAKIINSVINKVEKAGDVSREAIYQELRDLQSIIDESRREIGIPCPAEINDTHIPVATDELDAVVENTAQATGAIMDSCDALSEQAAAVGGAAGDAIMAEVTKIYEACSFQDITGQRITKVVRTLKSIEEKVGHLLQALGAHAADHHGEAETGEDESGEAGLLNGPQLPGHAISQDEIDKLLAEFDE